MLEAASDAGPVTAVGDTFDMDMDRTPLSDIPGLVKYKVRNTVTQFVPDRLFEWAVGTPERPNLYGHVYGWQIEPVSDTECDVTNYCDWTAVAQKYLDRRPWPVVPVEMLEKSVAEPGADRDARVAPGPVRPGLTPRPGGRARSGCQSGGMNR